MSSLPIPPVSWSPPRAPSSYRGQGFHCIQTFHTQKVLRERDISAPRPEQSQNDATPPPHLWLGKGCLLLNFVFLCYYSAALWYFRFPDFTFFLIHVGLPFYSTMIFILVFFLYLSHFHFSHILLSSSIPWLLPLHDHFLNVSRFLILMRFLNF